MYYGYPGKQDLRRQQYKQEPSKVLLVCVYDTIALQVTNQLIYQAFSKFGSIVKVLIFEKGQVTKLFVQYTQTRFAEQVNILQKQAKSTLDETKLLGAICKMNIYFSNFANVDLKNQTTEGADYTIQEEIKNQYIRRFDQISLSFQSEENNLLDDEYIMDSAFTPFIPRSKTDNPRRLQEQIHRLNVTPIYHNHSQSHQMINQQEELENMINHGINNILQTHSSHSQEYKYINKTNPSSQSSVQRINPNLRIKESQPVKSSALKFDLSKQLSIKNIYNLFSNFGNISFICKKNKKVYIKFRTMEFAAIARTYLNERSLMGNLLLLKFLENIEEASPKEGEYCESIYYDQIFDRQKLNYVRFTPHRSLTVNSPSQTLHVSSLKKDTCKENVLYKIFSDFGKVQAVKILCYSNEKNMALIKYYSMQDSFEAISTLHNQFFSGRKIQISFTKSRV